MVGYSQKGTLHSGFLLVGICQQGVPTISKKLMFPNGFKSALPILQSVTSPVGKLTQRLVFTIYWWYKCLDSADKDNVCYLQNLNFIVEGFFL